MFITDKTKKINTIIHEHFVIFHSKKLKLWLHFINFINNICVFDLNSKVELSSMNHQNNPFSFIWNK